MCLYKVGEEGFSYVNNRICHLAGSIVEVCNFVVVVELSHLLSTPSQAPSEY